MVGASTAPVDRTDLVTQDMNLIADRIRNLYVGHSGTFRRTDPAGVDARLHSVTASGLTAGLVHYGGFEYTAEVNPVGLPSVVAVTEGSGAVTAAREQLRYVPGDVFMAPADLPSTATVNGATYVSLHVPRAVVGAVAEEHTGFPATDLRFKAMAPVSAGRRRLMAKTIAFMCDELVTSGTTKVYPLIAHQMTLLAAAAMLNSFPNSAMTIPYLPGPGWVPPASVRHAVEFIEAHAGQPMTTGQIAATAGVTSRALHHAFRRYFGTTPTGYLRRVRLEHAYQELASADAASGLTVAAVARRWGWTSQQAFSVAYRQRFGVPPSHTLRT
jgi:AraC-like DNA-binding protein